MLLWLIVIMFACLLWCFKTQHAPLPHMCFGLSLMVVNVYNVAIYDAQPTLMYALCAMYGLYCFTLGCIGLLKENAE